MSPRSFGSVALAVLLAGCGVGAQASADRVPADDVPFGLLEPLDASASVGANSFDDATVYLVIGECLVAVDRDGAAVPSRALEALVAGPTAVERSADLRSSISLLAGPLTMDDRAMPLRIELPVDFLDLPAAEQRLGIAQLVVTIAPLVPARDVVFDVGSERVAVPLADGTTSAEPVVADQYAPLLAPTCTS